MIDSIYYQEGNTNNDKKLISYSNMNSLLKWIEENKDMPSIFDNIYEKEVSSYEKIVQEALSEMNHKMILMNNKKYSYLDELENTWIDNKGNIKNAWYKCYNYS